MSFDIEPDHQPEKEDWFVAENHNLRHVLSYLIRYSLTSRSPHKNWLLGLAEAINDANDVLGDPDRALVHPDLNNDGLIVKKSAPIRRISGSDVIL